MAMHLPNTQNMILRERERKGEYLPATPRGGEKSSLLFERIENEMILITLG